SQTNAIIECLQTTLDAKTLAQPRIFCLNGQEGTFQVGQKLGFKVQTTTQTSTLQSVNFLNVGVILTVTPRISQDDQILMHIRPELSDGQVDATTGLPSSNTTYVETNALLPSGRGIVIGGLIQETDNTNVNKIPGLGDIWLIGRLFQKRLLVRERAEVIIILLPRIVPYDPDYQCQEDLAVHRAETPLLHGRLEKHRRQWEPALYDAVDNPKPLRRPQDRSGNPRTRPLESVPPSAKRSQPRWVDKFKDGTLFR
ncbi:MAG TPA: type II and III secretion system protein, partial [Pirellulales bacterium]|nr:type II and III secretion system protein [Pirellulales bacterium]